MLKRVAPRVFTRGEVGGHGRAVGAASLFGGAAFCVGRAAVLFDGAVVSTIATKGLSAQPFVFACGTHVPIIKARVFVGGA